jgi:hypothetical protein
MKGRWAAAGALVLAVLVVGCGGSSDPARTAAEEGRVDAAYAAKANAICGQAVRQTARLGVAFRAHGLRAGESPLAVTTHDLIAPGLKIRERTAEGLRALGPPAEGVQAAAVFVGLFDPIEVLIRQRLQAGLEGNLDAATKTENLIQRLGLEQIAAAREAGMPRCATNLIKVAFEAGGG